MINNYVFDIGNVLLGFDPDAIVKEAFIDHSILPAFEEFVFINGLWAKLDKGLITDEEIVGNCITQFPKHKDQVVKFFTIWPTLMQPIHEMIEFLKERKKEGKKIYALSNFPQKGFEQVLNDHDFFDHFDGKIISSHVKAIKPEPEIYHELINQYSIKPSESLFMDDLEANIIAAKEHGFNAIQFLHFNDFIKKHKLLVN